MHGHATHESFAIEASHFATRIMETHEPMHFADSLERRVDGSVHLARCRLRDRDLHERAEQRACPANAI
jgi:hypothetical protein